MKSDTTRVKIRLGGYTQIGLVARNLRAKTVASPVDKGLKYAKHNLLDQLTGAIKHDTHDPAAAASS